MFTQGSNAKAAPEVFCKKGVLKNFTNFTEKHLCQSLFFNKVAGLMPAIFFIKKEALAQVSSCECCEISKNIFSTEHVWVRLFLKIHINRSRFMLHIVNGNHTYLNFYFIICI